MEFDEMDQVKFQFYQQKMLDMLHRERAGARRTRLYDHQIDAVLSTVNYFYDANRARNISGLIQVPTGGGKSVIISLLPYALGLRKVMVLSPGKVISDQLKLAFGGGKDVRESSYFKMGIVANTNDIEKRFAKPITITSSSQISDMSACDLVIVNAQKFARTAKPEIILNGRHGKIPAKIFDTFDTIIVDEAHHYPAATWEDIVGVFHKDNKKIIFLTATPKPNSARFCDIIYEISRLELERLRIIRKINFEPLDFQVINDVTNDELAELAVRMNDTLDQHDNTVTNVVHKAMVLVRNDRDYTREMADSFNDIDNLNLNATFCTSEFGSEENLADFNRNDNTFRIMVVCQRLTEGYDNSNVSVCVILRNIGSDILFNQFVGRCIRISQDRENLHDDDVVAKVYGPNGMWVRYERNAIADPEDED